MEKVVQTKKCRNCEEDFPIYEKDMEFYKMMEVDDPTHCYICRAIRRLTYRNERFLYQRKCDLTGEDIISCFSSDKPFPVYGIDAWWSDKWGALDYGRDFDFDRPFFEQFFELRNEVPRITLQQQKPMWNSDFCNCVSQNKNCYLVFSTNRCEDCYYGSWVNECKNCIDNKTITRCELCYDCFNCYDCYDLKYSRDCSNCKSSYFLRDCSGCMNCFACSNLHNKTYYIFNEKKTREEYEAFMKNVNMGSRKVVEDGKAKAQKMLGDLVVKEYHGANTENCSGDYLQNCKNCFKSFECIDCEDVRYCTCLEGAKSSMDHSHWGVGTERMYECQACGYDHFNLRFCNLCWTGCNDLTYCDQCFSSKNSFGCVGLRKNEYCIFNKQFTKEEYEKQVNKIIVHMKGTGEWGEFFPVADSTYAYNETLAQEEKPITKEQALAKGWPWKDKDAKEYKPQNYEVPDSITDISDSILTEILACKDCGKNYKIIPEELEFYRKQIVPVPVQCPDCRHIARLKFRNGRVLYDRDCDKCGKFIQTSYEEGRPEKVFCEECYLQAVY